MAKTKEKKEGGAGAKILTFFIVLLILLIWLAAMIILIKLDVGHFGSKVLRPVLKDVPVVKLILPAASDEEAAIESDLPYKTLAEALARLEELEATNEANTKTITTLQEENAEQVNEINRLKVFEQDQQEFTQLKNKFYEEVVYGSNAPDVENYITWYESIDKEAAEEIYRQVVASKEADADIKSLATAYAEMEPASAAKILQTMNGDLDTVVKIMDCMSPSDQAEILAAMDANFAANVTKKLMPK